MISVISPAKRLDFDSQPPVSDHTTPDFLAESRKLNRILREYSAPQLMELMGVSRNIAELNIERNRNWKTPFNPDNSRQAIYAFRGDVYQGLDADTLNRQDMKFAQQHLRILSGLYGLLRPLDLIQPYRLEMGTGLENPRGGNLYEFWGGKLADRINEELENHRSKTLINLASAEYYRALSASHLKTRVITPVFKEKKQGKYRVIAVFAKKARGLMARFIIKQRIDSPEGLKDFELDGYHYTPSLSDKNNWVFARG